MLIIYYLGPIFIIYKTMRKNGKDLPSNETIPCLKNKNNICQFCHIIMRWKKNFHLMIKVRNNFQNC